MALQSPPRSRPLFERLVHLDPQACRCSAPTVVGAPRRGAGAGRVWGAGGWGGVPGRGGWGGFAFPFFLRGSGGPPQRPRGFPFLGRAARPACEMAEHSRSDWPGSCHRRRILDAAVACAAGHRNRLWRNVDGDVAVIRDVGSPLRELRRVRSPLGCCRTSHPRR